MHPAYEATTALLHQSRHCIQTEQHTAVSKVSPVIGHGAYCHGDRHVSCHPPYGAMNSTVTPRRPLWDRRRWTLSVEDLVTSTILSHVRYPSSLSSIVGALCDNLTGPSQLRQSAVQRSRWRIVVRQMVSCFTDASFQHLLRASVPSNPCTGRQDTLFIIGAGSLSK